MALVEFFNPHGFRELLAFFDRVLHKHVRSLALNKVSSQRSQAGAFEENR